MEKLVNFSLNDEVVFANVENPSCELHITNKWNRQIMFKFKSTRPGVLRMRPVFGAINPNETAKVILSIRSKDLSELKFTRRDHFTCVFCPTPSNITSVSATWRSNTAKEIHHQSVRKVLNLKIKTKGAVPEILPVKPDINANLIQGTKAEKIDKISPKNTASPRQLELAKTKSTDTSSKCSSSKIEEEDDSTSSSSSPETEKSKQ